VRWRSLHLRWAAANALSGVLVGLSSALLGPTITPVDLLILGGLQWLVIRQYGTPPWWIVATAVGAFIGLLLGFPLFAVIQEGTGALAAAAGLSDSAVVLPPLAATFAVGGAVMGVAQVRVLRVPRPTAIRWVLASAVGLAAYAVAALFLGATVYVLLIPFGIDTFGLEGGQALVGAVGGALGGALYGIITAVVLHEPISPSSSDLTAMS
jgi:hypothetical protein